MNLLLWRHAEAEEGSPDLARALTRKGHVQATEVGHWLKKRLPAHATILASPAQRTRQTADALGLEYRIEAALAPGATPAAILEVLALAPDTRRDETLLLVGHQPWIGETAALLITGKPLSWSVRKASVWWLVHRRRAPASEWFVKAVIDGDLV
jgi:phosphohistidine phosphatase